MYRQLYQMGGMGVEPLPMDFGQPLQVSQPMSNYGQMMMARGGIANLVNREKYGIGSKLKKFVRNIIPNEISAIAVKAAPFVAPFNPLLAGAMAGIGGFDQTGRIGSSLNSAALTYGAGQIARGIGGAGFQEGFNPFAGYSSAGSFGGLGSLFTSPMGNVPFGSFTPTQVDLTGGVDALTYDPKVSSPGDGIFGSKPTAPTVGTVFEGPGGGTVVENLSLPSTDVGTNVVSNVASKATEGPTYGELIKKAGSFENVPLSERFNAVKDLSTKALTDLYTKPVINPKTGETTNVLDKNSLFATFAFASSYAEARKLADKAGVPESEFNEADYQRLKIDPEKAKYKDTLKDEAFGIRKAEGGRIGYGLGDLVRSSGVAVAMPGGNVSESRGLGGMIQKLMQQNPQMFRTQMSALRRDFIDNDNNGIDDREEAAGGGLMDEGVLSIKLTPAQAMAMGGRIGYQMGGLGSMDPMLALQRNPIDLYGYSDPVIAALTGNVFTSGQRFKDVFSPQAGLMMQQAQAAGYSEPEMEELRRQHDMFPGFQHNLMEVGIGQADPQQFAINFATDYRNRFLNPQPYQAPAQQRQPVQYQYSDRGTMIEQLGYQPGQLTPELQSQIDQYKRALNRVESIYNKPMANIGREDYNKMPYGRTGGMNYTPNEYLRESLKSEQDAAARVTPKKANGGRINYFMGSEIPVRQNQGGITELDLRAKGGYIPVGIKEKADDVPAMLSRNEFVFTADAVRGAGNGSINKGAQKMYRLMKSLEKKIKKVA